MENNERERKLDQWLDQALSEYSAAEPRYGLEQRVLNRVRTDEQARARKWNLWRWMPAFGAIAAVIIVAIAVGPMLQRKTPVKEMSSRIDAYSVPQEKKAQAPTPSIAERASRSKTLEVPEAKSPRPTVIADAARGNAALRRELKPEGGDRDRLIATRSAAKPDDLDSSFSDLKKVPAATAGKAAPAVNGSGVAPAPPPPPSPSPTLESSAADKGLVVRAQAVPSGATAKQSSPSAQAMEIQPPVAITEEKMTASESATALLGKDAKRKEAHAKSEPEAARADGNVFEAFGVKVRVQGGPTTQQFPTPAPLSKQEKLALAAAQQLKDSAVTQHKSLDIAPLEIRDIEIKPLEGPEK